MPEERISINTASAEELDQIPGSAGRTPRRIIESRERGNRFTCLEDPMDVPRPGRGAGEAGARRFAYE